jgi:hypothetical protein
MVREKAQRHTSAHAYVTSPAGARDPAVAG